MLKEIENKFLDKNYKKVENIKLDLSIIEKIMLLLPGFQIFMVKKILDKIEKILDLNAPANYGYIILWKEKFNKP